MTQGWHSMWMPSFDAAGMPTFMSLSLAAAIEFLRCIELLSLRNPMQMMSAWNAGNAGEEKQIEKLPAGDIRENRMYQSNNSGLRVMNSHELSRVFKSFHEVSVELFGCCMLLHVFLTMGGGSGEKTADRDVRRLGSPLEETIKTNGPGEETAPRPSGQSFRFSFQNLPIEDQWRKIIQHLESSFAFFSIYGFSNIRGFFCIDQSTVERCAASTWIFQAVVQLAQLSQVRWAVGVQKELQGEARLCSCISWPNQRRLFWPRDLAKLYEILETARSPTRLLMAKLEEMEDGQFVPWAKNGSCSVLLVVFWC